MALDVGDGAVEGEIVRIKVKNGLGATRRVCEELLERWAGSTDAGDGGEMPPCARRHLCRRACGFEGAPVHAGRPEEAAENLHSLFIHPTGDSQKSPEGVRCSQKPQDNSPMMIVLIAPSLFNVTY